MRTFLDGRVGQRVAEAGIVPSLYIDGTLSVGGANVDVVEKLARVGPFGAGNPEPRFAIPNARIAYARVVGDDHVKCTIEGEVGRMDGIAFRSLETDLGRTLLESGGMPIHLAGKLRVNAWQGRRSAELHIDDAAPLW